VAGAAAAAVNAMGEDITSLTVIQVIQVMKPWWATSTAVRPPASRRPGTWAGPRGRAHGQTPLHQQATRGQSRGERPTARLGDLDQVVAEVGYQPKSSAQCFHIGAHGRDRRMVQLGVFDLGDTWFGGTHLLGDIALGE